MLKQNKIAIFFDCENVSASYLQSIFSSLEYHGEVIISKAYNDWSNSKSLKWSQVLQEYAIEAIQVKHNTHYKNAADIKMVIDVMKTICTSSVDTIAIVSSDSDFTALAMEVKANNFTVLGLGEEKTPEALRNAYTTFIQLKKESFQKEMVETNIQKIKKLIDKHKDESGFTHLSKVGSLLSPYKNMLLSKKNGVNSWGDFFKINKEDFIVKLTGKKNSTLIVKNIS